MTCFTDYPTLARLLISLLTFVNLLCWKDAYALIHTARYQCVAQAGNRLQQFVQRLLFLPTMLTSCLPILFCFIGQPVAVGLIWAGNLPMAALLAVMPLLAFAVHLLVVAGGCLLMELLE